MSEIFIFWGKPSGIQSFDLREHSFYLYLVDSLKTQILHTYGSLSHYVTTFNRVHFQLQTIRRETRSGLFKMCFKI